jgi:predicted metal-binding protein
MVSLRQLDVFQVVDLPEAVRMLKNMWVLKRKRTQHGLIDCHTARLVAKGHTQVEEVDCSEVLARVDRRADILAQLHRWRVVT